MFLHYSWPMPPRLRSNLIKDKSISKPLIEKGEEFLQKKQISQCLKCVTDPGWDSEPLQSLKRSICSIERRIAEAKDGVEILHISDKFSGDL